MSTVKLANQAMLDLIGENFQHMIASTDYDSFVVVGGEKPSREAFEEKLQELINAQPLKELREERNKRLAACDWVAIRAFTTGTPVPDEWKVYMQTLRDLPANTEDPTNPVWPLRPGEVVPVEETPTE